MSFVSSVLCNAEKITISDAKNRVPILQTEVNEYKFSIDRCFEDIYTKHLEPQTNMQLEKAQKLFNEINTLSDHIDEISARNFQTIDDELIELRDNVIAAHFSINLIDKVVKIHESFNQIDEALKNQKYLEAVQQLDQLFKYMQTLSVDCNLKCIERLMEKASEYNEKVSFDLENIMGENIILYSNVEDNVVMKSISSTVPNDFLSNIFAAYYLQNMKSDTNLDHLNRLITFIWTDMLSEIICHKTKLVATNASVKISYNPQVVEKDSYTDVFEKLIQFFENIKYQFNYQLDTELTLMQYIGADIRDNLSELLIKQCLADTIPTTPEGLAQYNQVITDTEAFQRRLIDLEIFEVDTKSIIDYANNVELHFINKKCNQYMSNALSIMKEDLHDIVEVGGDENVINKFSLCSVSKSVLKLLQLGEKILDRATKTSEISTVRLFSTVQNIFNIYPSSIKEYHSDLLDIIPQQVAIFYNNCMYLAHVIADLNSKYVARLHDSAEFLDSRQFSGIGKTLIEAGTGAFDNCIQSQVKSISASIKQADLEALKTNDKLNFDNVEKAFRQCLRQLELLKTVWQKVLPTNHYNGAIGLILDAKCKSVLSDILSAEDLSSATAEQLVEVLKLVLTRAPKLFKPNTNLPEFVPNWNRLSGLVFILHASMMDICDKWTNRSKSDLFQDYKAYEIRQLIKAIFQNSDRRANILAKIQD